MTEPLVESLGLPLAQPQKRGRSCLSQPPLVDLAHQRRALEFSLAHGQDRCRHADPRIANPTFLLGTNPTFSFWSYIVRDYVNKLATCTRSNGPQSRLESPRNGSTTAPQPHPPAEALRANPWLLDLRAAYAKTVEFLPSPTAASLLSRIARLCARARAHARAIHDTGPRPRFAAETAWNWSAGDLFQSEATWYATCSACSSA